MALVDWKCSLQKWSTSSYRTLEETGQEIEVTLIFQLSYTQFWVRPALSSSVQQMGQYTPWINLSVPLDNLHRPVLLILRLLPAISELEIPNRYKLHIAQCVSRCVISEAAVALRNRLRDLTVNAIFEISSHRTLGPQETFFGDTDGDSDGDSDVDSDEDTEWTPEWAPAMEDVIESLRTKIFRKETKNLNQTCVICFEEFVQDSTVKELPCLHIFDEDCIAKWLSQNGCCPICKFQLQT